MHTPLADQIRPASLDDVVGQRQLLAPGKPLRRIIESGKIPNMIFYGPSGVGKTTVARIIADSTSMTLHKLNGTSASTADIRDVVAEVGTFSGMNGILLYLDEIQYFNKKQQQLLLEYMENGQITLIASTTENPYFAVYNALISRSTVFEFKPVPPEEMERAVARGFRCMAEQLGEEIHLSDGVCGWIARGCGGDVRKAMNTVELIVLSGEHTENGIVISDELAQELTQRSNMRYDRDNDQHYDLLSALQKSIRGSDENAALHYAARLLAANDQLLFEKSYEYGEHAGLGFIQGEVCPLEPDLTDKSLKVPQIGWNALHIVKDDPLFQYIREGEYVYYVHSYYGKNCTESTLATSEYSIPVTGAVRAGKVYGTQFHPEKSGDTGLRILKAFAEL